MTASSAPDVADHMAISHPSTNYARAAAWEEFIHVVLDVLRRAERELRQPATWRRFAERDGWWLSAQRKADTGTKVLVPSEDAITDALTELAESIRRDADTPNPVTLQHITFDPQVRRPPHPRIGRKALTTDIRARSLAVPELEVRIEAKLLFRPKDLTGAYCGEKGLLRFADPKHPYTDRPVGFMLGYSLQDYDPNWDAQVATFLQTIDRVGAVGQVTVGNTKYYISDLAWGDDEHQKVSVIHLFMNFETEPSSRSPSGAT